ncbi:hypothetical protein Tco_1338518 [Tanacetum coccineum]
MTQLLEKNLLPFIFSVDCIRAFQTLKDRLTSSNLIACSKLGLVPFELMSREPPSAADHHCPDWKNPYENVNDPKEINESLPLETVNMVTFAMWCTANEALEILSACHNGPTRDIMEVDINKKTENQAKMTKLSMEWKRRCKIKAKVQKCQSQSQYRRISSQTGAGTEEYYWMQS